MRKSNGSFSTVSLCEVSSMSDNYRLYVGDRHYYFPTFDSAKLAAQKFEQSKPQLRIEVLIETDSADFWAYDYQLKQWLPS